MSDGKFVAPQGQNVAQRRMEQANRYNAWLLDRGRAHIGKRVLDVGAGLGPFVELLSRSAEVVALEPDPVFAENLRRRFADRANVCVTAIDVEALGRDESLGLFDTVICFNVLEHVADDANALRLLRERLLPGGHLLVIVPAHQSLFGEIDRAVGHQRRYSRSLLNGRLDEAGLEVIDLRYVNPIGAFGWLAASVVFRRSSVPAAPLSVYDRLIPLLRALDHLRLPFGLSVWAIARRAPDVAPAPQLG